MEFGWAVRPRNRADKKRDVSLTLSTKDACIGESFERNEDSRYLPKRDKNDGLPERWASIDIQEATFVG